MEPLRSQLYAYPVRLKPGEDLVDSLRSLVTSSGLRAAFVLTCCGSIKGATIRFAERGDGRLGQQEVRRFDEHFEICSLVGTICGGEGGGHHLHIVLGRSDGTTIAGHLSRGPATVFTTAEVVLGECGGAEFSREEDEETGYTELKVRERRRRRGEED